MVGFLPHVWIHNSTLEPEEGLDNQLTSKLPAISWVSKSLFQTVEDARHEQNGSGPGRQQQSILDTFDK